MDQWAAAVGHAVGEKSSDMLAQCFPLSVDNSNVAVLQNILWAGDATQTISQFQPSWNWTALVLFARDYLRWCFSVNPRDLAASRPLVQKMMGSLQRAFSQVDGYLLNDVIIAFVSAQKNDLWVAEPLLRIFNTILSEREPSKKQEILLFSATRLCRIYLDKEQISLCSTVFNSLDKKSLEEYPIGQRVELRYAKGRFALRQGKLTDAFNHLDWSYRNCISGPNKNKVFGQVLLPGILTGHMPTAMALQNAAAIDENLHRSIRLIYIAIKGTQFSAYEEALSTAWVHREHVAGLLQSTVPMLICRRAMKRLHRALGAPKSLNYQQVRAALQAASYVGNDSDFEATETMCIGLIDSRMVYANLFPNPDASVSVLRMRPNDPVPSLGV